jgi:hypothetical protein
VDLPDGAGPCVHRASLIVSSSLLSFGSAIVRSFLLMSLMIYDSCKYLSRRPHLFVVTTESVALPGRVMNGEDLYLVGVIWLVSPAR